MTRKFGFECELTGGTQDVVNLLYSAGLMNTNSVHSYHCSCSDCDPHRGGLIHAQNDCTVDGELISKALVYGSAEAERVFVGLADALRKARATVHTNAGFHVHVGAEDLTEADMFRLWRLYFRYEQDLAELAAARFDAVRDYNGPVNPSDVMYGIGTRGGRFAYDRNAPVTWRPEAESMFWRCSDEDIMYGRVALQRQGKQGWLWGRSHYGTYEFRLWNATVAEWRMRLAVGVSVAMVNAAKAGVNVTLRTRRPLEAVLEPWLDEPTWAGIIRQRYTKGGVAA